MKKLFFIAAIAALVSSCGTGVKKTPVPGHDNLQIVCLVAEDTLYGVQTIKGNEVIPTEYLELTFDNDDDLFIAIEQTGEKSFFSTMGAKLFSAEQVEKNDSLALWIATAPEGQTIFDPATQTVVGPYTKIVKGPDQYLVWEEEKMGVLATSGDVVLDPTYDKIVVVKDKTTTAYLVYNDKMKKWQKFDSQGQPTPTIYYPKAFNKLQKGAISSWEYGFTLKKL